MKLKTIFVLMLMMIVALFSVQNASVITVRFLHWEFALSQALVIILSAFCGTLVGLAIGALGGLSRPKVPPQTKGPEPTAAP